MAIATVQLPDGRIAEVEVPNGATEDDLHNFLSQQFGGNQQAQEPQREQGFLEKAGDFAKGIPQGLGNKFVGAVQTGAQIFAPESDFNKNLANQVTNLKQQQDQLSGPERAGILGGEIAGDVALSPPKGLGFMGQAIGSGAVSGLTTPLEESGRGARLKEIATDTAIGAGFGKGAELIGGVGRAAKEGANNVYKGTKSRVPEELQIASQQLKQKASDLYKSADEIGAKFKPSAAKLISNKIANSIKEGGPLFKANHGNTISVVKDIQQDIEKRGYQIGFAELDQYAQALKDVVSNNTDIAGKVNSDGFKALKGVNKIDDIFQKLPDKYLINPKDRRAVVLKNQATEEYHRYRKFEKIANLAEKAAGDPNKIKSNIYRFTSNKKNLRGFTREEIESLKKAGNLTTTEGLYKMLGKFGFDKGTSVTFGNTALPALGASGAFAAGGTPAGLGVVAAGTAARQAQKYLARGKLEDALRLIESSENPSKVIAKIPNRKMQEKLLSQLMAKGGTAMISESNNQF